MNLVQHYLHSAQCTLVLHVTVEGDGEGQQPLTPAHLSKAAEAMLAAHPFARCSLPAAGQADPALKADQVTTIPCQLLEGGDGAAEFQQWVDVTAWELSSTLLREPLLALALSSPQQVGEGPAWRQAIFLCADHIVTDARGMVFLFSSLMAAVAGSPPSPDPAQPADWLPSLRTALADSAAAGADQTKRSASSGWSEALPSPAVASLSPDYPGGSGVAREGVPPVLRLGQTPRADSASAAAPSQPSQPSQHRQVRLDLNEGDTAAFLAAVAGQGLSVWAALQALGAVASSAFQAGHRPTTSLRVRTFVDMRGMAKPAIPPTAVLPCTGVAILPAFQVAPETCVWEVARRLRHAMLAAKADGSIIRRTLAFDVMAPCCLNVNSYGNLDSLGLASVTAPCRVVDAGLVWGDRRPETPLDRFNLVAFTAVSRLTLAITYLPSMWDEGTVLHFLHMLQWGMGRLAAGEGLTVGQVADQTLAMRKSCSPPPATAAEAAQPGAIGEVPPSQCSASAEAPVTAAGAPTAHGRVSAEAGAPKLDDPSTCQ